MRKYLAAILSLTIFLGLNPNSGIIFANPQDATSNIFVIESYEDVPGIASRDGGSGRMLSRVNQTPVVLRAGGGTVGFFTTQTWWEVDLNRNMRGFGVQQMQATRGPHHTIAMAPRAEIFGSFMPHPTTASVTLRGTFFSGPFSAAHRMYHGYRMYTHGTHSFTATGVDI